ncbi:alpha/beta fold hydrolase [Desulfurivibrio alkaliphilus]|uniref:Alpha/beta hydrolase fold protein n=1 Tax=Desulfurivibrio alkaliphilus (strain DSM 19089 / UNIQEM U267 / AHT2) TaxID=589865 RepID=D6Z0R9_DESAT|nr:alpha/beta hydrolase [Desulfurivibrio alkaliphilus]ADH85298.1 alpha/beta hydrolase fold protein [Desulfurivibrio alkaliphilus AHT 2]
MQRWLAMIFRVLAVMGLVALTTPALADMKPEAEGPEAMTIKEHRLEEPIFGGQAYLLEAGRGNSPTLLLVHGLGEQASGIWHDLLPELAVEYHVLAVDLPGFGRSDKLNALYSPQNYAAYLNWLAESFSSGPMLVVGHSMGGTVALRFAADWPQQVKRLVLANVAGVLHRKVITQELLEPDLQQRLPGLPAAPLSRLDNWLSGIIAGLPDLPLDINQVLNNDTLRARLLGGDPAKIAALAVAEENFNRDLRGLATPAFIIWGAEDHVTPLRTGLLLETLLPKAQLQVIPEAGHVPMREQPELFRSALQQALTAPTPAAKAKPWPGVAENTASQAERVGSCQDQHGLIFSGRYDRLIISGCRNVRLRRVEAASLTIRDSQVTIEQSRLTSTGIAMQVTNSAVKATGLRVEGETALVASGSRLDLAGVELVGHDTAALAEAPSLLLFSVSRSESSHGRYFLHGEHRLLPDAPL